MMQLYTWLYSSFGATDSQSTLVVSSGLNISDMLCSSWTIESIGCQTSPAPTYWAHQSDLTWRLPLLALRQTAGEGSFWEDDEQIVCWYSLHHARWHFYIYNTFHVAVSAWVQKGNVDFGTISCKWRSTYNSISLVPWYHGQLGLSENAENKISLRLLDMPFGRTHYVYYWRSYQWSRWKQRLPEYFGLED